MKRFLINILLFLVIFAIGLYSRSFYLLITEEYKTSVNGSDTYNAIAKSKQKKKSRKVLLGDSVGRQLFENTKYNDTINSFACNQAIGLAGHYLLLNNFLNTGNEVDTVYMIFRPSSFLNNLDEKYTFHYFLKPFYKDEYKHLFTQTVLDQIRKIPFHFLSQNPALLTSNWSPDFKAGERKSFTFFSPISAEYMTKIKQLSIKHNFVLIILPSPVSNRSRMDIAAIDKSEISNLGLDKEFENYFSQILFLDDTSFMDGVHLNHPETYTQYYKDYLVHY